MKKKHSLKGLFCLSLLLTSTIIFGQKNVNYNESKTPEYTLQNPLELLNGEEVLTTEMWIEKRRPEILKLFKEQVYGKIPGTLKMSSYEIVESSNHALDDTAIRKQVVLKFSKNSKELNINILVYLPKNNKNAPLFVGYNFSGNHTIVNEKEVLITNSWVRNNKKFGISNHKASENDRGIRTHRWAVDKIIEAGYGIATIYYGDIDPDKNDFSDGVHPFFYNTNQSKPKSNEWGSISAWAWGLTKVMNYFEKDKDINDSKVIVMGHSRLGKTSLWAGAIDERFSMVISNNSGCGGAALSRREIGETVQMMNERFPHWCCDNYNAYNRKVNELPIDQHLLISLMAPRPVYIASAEDDKWADPKGEFLAGYYASPVYNLFGKKGITSLEIPSVNQPIHNDIAYHIRTGKHDVTEYDWEQYILFANQHFK
jgi:hypothetical protein